MLAVVVCRTFTLGSVDLRASLFTDHRCVILFFACLIFAVGLDREIILTDEIFPIYGRYYIAARDGSNGFDSLRVKIPICHYMLWLRVLSKGGYAEAPHCVMWPSIYATLHSVGMTKCIGLSSHS